MKNLHLVHKIASCVPTGLRKVSPEAGIISFTFDDFPHCSCGYARESLGREGVLATWYVAGGLTGGRENGIAYHTIGDLHALRDAGHEIGSHGYSHIRSSTLSRNQFGAEVKRNDRFLTDCLGNVDVTNFAYPFGRVSISSKLTVLRRFTSARGASAGLNRGWCDFAQLRASSIDQRTVQSGEVEALIGETARTRAWLILFAHDISPAPSRWGATPVEFARVVKAATSSGSRVLSVRDAIRSMNGKS
jgi:peptidoglycan/xylan/chitin deacetylase (PgdA/CDA1 family)